MAVINNIMVDIHHRGEEVIMLVVTIIMEHPQVVEAVNNSGIIMHHLRNVDLMKRIKLIVI